MCESCSCDPNLNIFNVYVDCLDPDMPRLCLFAKREIKRGEQISFDYRQSTGNTDSKNTIKGSNVANNDTNNETTKQEADMDLFLIVSALSSCRPHRLPNQEGCHSRRGI